MVYSYYKCSTTGENKMTNYEIKTRNEIRAFIKSSKLNALRAWVFIFKAQTPSEHALKNTLFLNNVGLNNHFSEHRTFESILAYVYNNQASPTKKYLLTKSQWNLVQNTDKLSKYWRQINFMLTSENPEMELVRIALKHHVDGKDDIPTFQL